MGLNRVVPASATMPSITQTHSPSGPNNPPLSSSIKAKYMADLEASMPVHCRSENWEESYQDLSSWCSGTSANSPAICQLPVTDETPVCGLDFQGEIDFDLRKSEEIASIPLEEDCSFNLWGSGSTLLSDGSSPSPPVVADSAVEKSNSVLLKDCWWSEIEEEKVVKELESSRPHTITNLSIKNHVSDDIPSTSVKEEVVDAKENMNPVSVPPPLLSDPVKVAELLSRFERIASMTHPGVNSKAKAVDLMKILQEQIAASNRKKYRGPPAVADLHNYSKVQPEFVAPVLSASAAVVLPEPHQVALTTPNPLSGNSGYIFQSDPFEGLFSMPEDSASINAGVLENGTHQVFPQNLVAAPAFILNTFHPSSVKTVMQIDEGSATLPTNDLFSEAHHEIMREAIKPQQLPSQFPTPHQQPISTQQHSFITSNQSFNISNQASIALPATKLVPTHFGRETGLTIHMPTPRIMPDLDLNFDALLFGTPVGTEGSSKVPAISTPEVLKPLVETPDPESFDLLSYLCDDKVNTPSVTLDNNPFHFSHTNTSNNTTISEHKPNVMVVKPLTPVKVEGEEHLIKSEGSTGAESPVVVELKPQISPKSLSDVEEESFDEDSVPKESSELTVEEQISPRPSRSSRKRKYSDDEFVMSPSPSEENLRPSRRRRTTSSKYDSDEDFTLPVRKTRKKSVTAIWEEEEEDVKPKRPRAGSSGRRRERTISSASESDRYRELRDRNNEASRKSRLTRKAREQELGRQADVLTKENQTLKVKVGEMENLVKKLREALLQSMMKK